MPQPPATSRRQAFFEIAMIFAVFCIQGTWPVPDVNEPYYLGKAIHFWNPHWLQGDFFMESADTHKVFYFTFGWLSLWLSPVALAWTGRIVTWLGLAWAWRRLSVAIVPRPWYSILTATLFACLMERCHMAGEWLLGGVEAKGFAYFFVLLAIEAVVRNRWNAALVLLGIASAFHAVVGGWAAVATGLAWLWLGFGAACVKRTTMATVHCAHPTDLPSLRALWPWALLGLVLAMPGIVPSLALDWGADRQTVHQAHEIYVFYRLPHHLILTGMRPKFIVRMVVLCGVWALLVWLSTKLERTLVRGTGVRGQSHFRSGEDWDSPREKWDGRLSDPVRLRRLRAYVIGAVLISLAGAMIQLLLHSDRTLAADVLRYYWFRLTDVAIPLGVALETAAIVTHGMKAVGDPLPRQWRGFCSGLLSLAVLVAAFHVVDMVRIRLTTAPPRSHKIGDLANWQDWREACAWIKDSGEIPPGARFIVPRLAQTFSWYSGHSDVVTWKDVPQDARKLVQWRDRMEDVFGTHEPPPAPRWHERLSELPTERLKQLAAKYDADYVLMDADSDSTVNQVHRNGSYVIYRLR